MKNDFGFLCHVTYYLNSKLCLILTLPPFFGYMPFEFFRLTCLAEELQITVL